MEERLMKTQETIINGATYTICENGEVYGKQGLITQRPNTDGYASFTAGRKGNRTRECTHRLVTKFFVPNPNGYPEVDHKDANRMNPSADNLEWVTRKENVQRAYRRGNHEGRISGTMNPKAKLNEVQVRMLRSLYEQRYSIRELFHKYGIAESTIGNIVHRHTWKHVK